MAESPRVLSIQSHVVHGYVGNRSAVFPLQILGFEVDIINSVQFSNHTGYKKFTGQIITEKELDVLIDGLNFNGLNNYSYLLTGYNASATMLQRITSLLQHLRQINPNLIYVCDPVMGDNGKFYVPQELLPIYRNNVIPLADIITPNQFELELLAECKINNIDEAWIAIQKLHDKGCKTVVISSSELGDEEYMIGLASKKSGEKVIIKIPKLPASFTGTGDLFAALFLAWMHETGNKLKDSLERTISTLQAVLRRTLQAIEGKEQTPQNMELKLIQSKKDIENPKIVVKAEYV